MKRLYYILANIGAGMPCFIYNSILYEEAEEAEEVAEELMRFNKGIYEAWVEYEEVDYEH